MNRFNRRIVICTKFLGDPFVVILPGLGFIVSLEHFATLAVAFSLANITAEFVGGWAAESFSKRSILLVATASNILGILLFLIGKELAIFIFAEVALGVGLGLGSNTDFGLVRPSSQRRSIHAVFGRYWRAVRGLSALGAVAFSVLAGVLFSYSRQGGFLLALSLELIKGGLFLCCRESKRVSRYIHREKTDLWPLVQAVNENRNLVVSLLIQRIAIEISGFLVIPLLVKTGWSSSCIGLLRAAEAGAEFVASILLNRGATLATPFLAAGLSYLGLAFFGGLSPLRKFVAFMAYLPVESSFSSLPFETALLSFVSATAALVAWAASQFCIARPDQGFVMIGLALVIYEVKFLRFK